MNSNWYRPAQVFAQLTKHPGQEPKRDDQEALQSSGQMGEIKERKITVHETGEASLTPDRARVIITYSTVKESVEAVKQSVTRRVDYVLQTLRNNGIKESLHKLHKSLQRTENSYQMDVEITVEFQDFKLCENVCNFLVEKLDENVKVSKPVFYHSEGRIESLRRQACLNAVRNARLKALSIAQFLNQKLGSAISIQEDDVSEYTGLGTDVEQNFHELGLQARIEAASITVIIKVCASFAIEPRSKKKQR